MPLILCVSDGAGSAARSDEGSNEACRHFVAHFSTLFEGGLRCQALKETDFREWMAECRTTLRNIALEGEASPRDFACTFLGAILGEESSVFVQLGDGGIVVADPESPGGYAPVFWPEQTEYANVTHFITALDAEDHLYVTSVSGRVEEVALFSDGLQRMALHMSTRSAHGPFFRAMFGPLRGEPVGVSERHEGWLREFLNSPAVLERTDDDKSLAMATRYIADSRLEREPVG